MKCDLIQPDLLDYSKGLLSRSESKAIKVHLEQCADCAAVLEEEVAFERMIAAQPDERPANDVWALVRAQTKPRRFSRAAVLHRLSGVSVRRWIAASATMAAVVCVFYGVMSSVDEPTRVPTAPPPVAKAIPAASDEPLAKHTDTMIAIIEDM